MADQTAKDEKRKPGVVRLYRFYLISEGQYGERFAMCDEHKRQYREPTSVIMEEISGETDWPCNRCEHEAEALAATEERDG